MAPLITPSGDVTSDAIVNAELLNEYVSSIFQTDNNIIPPSPQQQVFTIAKVKTLMRKLNPKSAAVRTVFLLYFLKAVNTHYPHL